MILNVMMIAPCGFGGFGWLQGVVSQTKGNLFFRQRAPLTDHRSFDQKRKYAWRIMGLGR